MDSDESGLKGVIGLCGLVVPGLSMGGEESARGPCRKTSTENRARAFASAGESQLFNHWTFDKGSTRFGTRWIPAVAAGDQPSGVWKVEDAGGCTVCSQYVLVGTVGCEGAVQSWSRRDFSMNIPSWLRIISKVRTVRQAGRCGIRHEGSSELLRHHRGCRAKVIQVVRVIEGKESVIGGPIKAKPVPFLTLRINTAQIRSSLKDFIETF